MHKSILFCIVCLLVIAPLGVIAAQDMVQPSVTVSDQVSLNGTVYIASAYSAGPGFVVIHIDNNGAPGPVAGYAWLSPGMNTNIEVEIDASMATPTMYAMLHVDDGAVGTYEFDGSSELDNPVSVDGNVVTPAFKVQLLDADDQFISGDSVTIGTVIVDQAGWVVIHNQSNGGPGPVLGETLIPAGVSHDVQVTLSADNRTSVVWPMLHVDDGTIGTYEFDGSSGKDNPVAVNGTVATSPLWTVPHMRADDQIVIPGDGMTMMEGMTPSVHIHSVLSQGPGFVVIHVDNNGAPGPVAGYAAVPDGYTDDVEVPLDQGATLTNVLWPMLHVDDGTIGTYEFDGSSGKDNPVSVDGNVVTFPINVAPSLTLTAQAVGSMDGNATVTINSALIDESGWVVIHMDNNGAPGPVIGETQIRPGLNEDVVVEIDGSQAGTQVFPMLHYDTGAAGVYEFDGSSGLDNPVSVGGNVVVAPLTINAQ